LSRRARAAWGWPAAYINKPHRIDPALKGVFELSVSGFDKGDQKTNHCAYHNEVFYGMLGFLI